MAYIKEISYCLESSVKIGEFQYEKPRICMTSSLENGDSHKKVFAELKAIIDEKMEAIKDELKCY